MNNEPVAWINKAEGILSFDYMGAGFIPLYTHPVKELTDEEIAEVFFGLEVGHSATEFARAILRKEQEK